MEMKKKEEMKEEQEMKEEEEKKKLDLRYFFKLHFFLLLLERKSCEIIGKMLKVKDAIITEAL